MTTLLTQYRLKVEELHALSKVFLRMSENTPISELGKLCRRGHELVESANFMFRRLSQAEYRQAYMERLREKKLYYESGMQSSVQLWLRAQRTSAEELTDIADVAEGSWNADPDPTSDIDDEPLERLHARRREVVTAEESDDEPFDRKRARKY